MNILICYMPKRKVGMQSYHAMKIHKILGFWEKSQPETNRRSRSGRARFTRIAGKTVHQGRGRCRSSLEAARSPAAADLGKPPTIIFMPYSSCHNSAHGAPICACSISKCSPRRVHHHLVASFSFELILLLEMLLEEGYVRKLADLFLQMAFWHFCHD